MKPLQPRVRDNWAVAVEILVGPSDSLLFRAAVALRGGVDVECNMTCPQGRLAQGFRL